MFKLSEVNISHLDLKPDNMLLDETQKIIKLADFGCSRINKRTVTTTWVKEQLFTWHQNSMRFIKLEG